MALRKTGTEGHKRSLRGAAFRPDERARKLPPVAELGEVINHGFWMFFWDIVIPCNPQFFWGYSNPQKKEIKVIDHCLSSWELPSGKLT